MIHSTGETYTGLYDSFCSVHKMYYIFLFSIQQNFITEDYLLVCMRDNLFKNIYTFLYITLESVNYLQIVFFFFFFQNIW